MEREIKFRGWSNKCNRWIYGYYFKYGNRTVIYKDCYCWEVLSSSIGQFTGLYDKNGNEIYEGDLLYQEQELLGNVCFTARYGISVEKKTYSISLINFVVDSDFDAGFLSDIEICGNIYENSKDENHNANSKN